MRPNTKLEYLFSSKTKKRLDLREELWLKEFKKIAVSLSKPISFQSFAHQSLHQREDYLETATLLSVNGISADQGCDLFNNLKIKLEILENEIFLKSALSSGFNPTRKNQTRIIPNKTCFLEQVRRQSIEELEAEWNSCTEELLIFLNTKAKLKKKIQLPSITMKTPFMGIMIWNLSIRIRPSSVRIIFSNILLATFA